MHVERPESRGGAVGGVAAIALGLQGCTDGAAAAGGAWWFAGLALVGAAWLAYRLGAAGAVRAAAAALREAREENRRWATAFDRHVWRSDPAHRLTAWQPPIPGTTAAPPPSGAVEPSTATASAALPEGALPLGCALTAVFDGGAGWPQALAAGRGFDDRRVVARDPAALGGAAWVLSGQPVYDEAGAFAGHAGFARCVDGAGQATATLHARLAEHPLEHPAAPSDPPSDSLPHPHSDPPATTLPALQPEGAPAPPPATSVAASAAIAAEAEHFSFTVSHDLRAPLRVVEGFTKILKEDYGPSLDRVGNDHLDRVLGAATRMNLMIDALLTLARLSSQPLLREPVNLSQLAGYVVDDLRRSAPERDAEVTIEPGLLAHGDPTLLRLVLENLLGNAWKYTVRTPKAQIAFRRVRDGERDAFEVVDNGAGFDMRSAERLFGLFQRLHSANDFPGHGVGLASVRRIVQRHGGEIWAEAEAGRGARFRFTLAG